MKRILSIFIIACILLCGCEGMLSLPQKQRTATYLDLFDTVTSIVGYARSEEEFQNQAQKLHDAGADMTFEEFYGLSGGDYAE